MNLINASVTIESHAPNMLKVIERAGRTAYRSEDAISDKSDEAFISMIIQRGHESVLEHGHITARIICSRAIANEIVRHRHFSYTQESTRYCSYDKGKFNGEITYIIPEWLKKEPKSHSSYKWQTACAEIEKTYMFMLKNGLKAQDARGILPLDLKTEIVMTGNVRSWREFLKQRISTSAHPDMRFIAKELLYKFQNKFKILFLDIKSE